MDIRCGRVASAGGFTESAADVGCLTISATGWEAGDMGEGKTYFNSTQ
jgi:hypothetical protein